jgi:hypothetical protein
MTLNNGFSDSRGADSMLMHSVGRYRLLQLKDSRISRALALALAVLFIPAVGWAAPQASAYGRLASWLRRARNNAVEFTQGGPYDVRTFGAVLNGVTDDAVAIQRAVDQGGKIVFPPNSTAYISVPIRVPSNTVIDCRNSTIKTVSGGSIFRAIGSASNPLVGVEIENCNLDGQASTLGVGNSSSVIYLDYVNGFSIQHDTVRNCGWWCVQADFSNSGLIANNYFANTYGDCAGWQQGANVKLVNNTCDGFSDGGFSANVNASSGVIAGNVLENGRANSFGIEAAGAHDVTISSNIVEGGYGQNGIRVLANDGADAYAVTVANNTVGNARSGQFCINLTAPNQAAHPSSPLVVTNNLLNCASGNGIYVWADNTTVHGNTIATSGTGIVLDGNSSTTSNNLFVNGNVIVGAANAVTSAPSTVVVNAVTVDNVSFPAQ